MDGRFIRIRADADGFEQWGLKEFNFGHCTQGNDLATPSLVWQWDGQTLRIKNCRYGIVPCYYLATKNEFIASLTVNDIIEAGYHLTIDEVALSTVLCFGSLIGNCTVFQEIRRLPPQSNLTWTKTGVTLVKRPITFPTPIKIGRQEALHTFNELFANAVEKTPIPDDFALPLTGGRDSRHILFELIRQERIPKLCISSRDSTGDEDSKIARVICKRLDVPCRTTPFKMRRLAETQMKNRDTSFTLPGQHQVVWSLTDYLLDANLPIFDGIGGDVWIQGQWLTDKRYGLFSTGQVSKLRQEFIGSRSWYYHYLGKRARSRISPDLAMGQIQRAIEDFASAANPISALAFWNYTRSGVSSYTYGLLAGKIDVFAPYLEPEIHDFMSSLPPSITLDGKFHTDAINQAFPNLTDIPYAVSKSPVPSGLPRLVAWQFLLNQLGRTQTVFSRDKLLVFIAKRIVKSDFVPNALIYIDQIFELADNSST